MAEQLQIKGKRYNGAWEALGEVAGFSLTEDRFAACSSLEVEVLLANKDRLYIGIILSAGGETLFEGVVDSQEMLITSEGRRRVFRCRSLSAGMADNELKPDTYFKPTAQTMFAQFAQPFGMKGTRFSSDPGQNYLVVEQGMSCWDAMDLYCRQVYHTPLYADREGYLQETAAGNTKSAWLSNSRSDGIRYSSISLIYNRSSMLSKVYLKTNYEMEENPYDIVLENPKAASRRIQRQRYLNPNERWYRDINRCGQNALFNSNIDCEVLTATLPGLQNLLIGTKVFFSEPVGEGNDYRVYRVEIRCNGGENQTKIYACHEEYI